MHNRIKVAFSCLLFAILLVGHTFMAPPQVSAQSSSSLTGIKHVFVIVMENHDWSAINATAAPYMNNTLIKSGSFASNYHNVPTSMGSLHPSEPNYMWFEGGTNAYPDFTFTTDANSSNSNSTSSTAHLTTLLNAKGLSWKAYQENMPANTCPINSSGQYAAKHNPFVYFKDVAGNPPSTTNAYCLSHHAVLTAANLQNDLSTGKIANYNFLTPNLCNDMHDCSVQTGDTWLSQMVPVILNSAVFKQDGALFITWDEGGSGNNPIGMIIVSPKAKINYKNTIAYSHASLVKTVENIFGLSPYVGHAADSTVVDLSDFFSTSVQSPLPSPSAIPSPSPSSTPSPKPTPTPTPTPKPTPTPSPIASPSPSPSACATPTILGTLTTQVTVPSAGTYKVWARILAKDSTSGSYYLRVDSGCPVLVSNPSIATNQWTWVSSTVTLTQGAHTIDFMGISTNTQVDRLIVNDGTCIPTSNGDNCVTTSVTPTPASSPTPNACDNSDINQDNTVNLLDYSILLGNFVKTPITVPRADINTDGKVDISDYSLLLAQFFKTCH